MKKENRMKPEEKLDAFSELMDHIYELVDVSSQYQKFPKNYGTEDLLYMAEVHLLQQIAKNDGITVTQLAQIRGKSSSSISQLVNKLVRKGMICREAIPNDKKRFKLRLTEKGEIVNTYHEKYDKGYYLDTLKKADDYSLEDMKLFTSLLDLIKNDIRDMK